MVFGLGIAHRDDTEDSNSQHRPRCAQRSRSKDKKYIDTWAYIQRHRSTEAQERKKEKKRTNGSLLYMLPMHHVDIHTHTHVHTHIHRQNTTQHNIHILILPHPSFARPQKRKHTPTQSILVTWQSNQFRDMAMLQLQNWSRVVTRGRFFFFHCYLTLFQSGENNSVDGPKGVMKTPPPQRKGYCFLLFTCFYIKKERRVTTSEMDGHGVV